MNRVLDRKQARDLKHEVSHIRGWADSAREIFLTSPGRWAGSHPHATLGVIGGLGIVLGLTIGLLVPRR